MSNSLILPSLTDCSVAIIGLGYVGFPLAVELAKCRTCLLSGNLLNRHVTGFDLDDKRINELKRGFDRTNELSSDAINLATNLILSSDPSKITSADVFIITVPTPIDTAKRPDLSPLKSASITVGQALKLRRLLNIKTLPIVIYESTVYPGATEDFCIPIIEDVSGLTSDIDFSCGYSPERINPGDKSHSLKDIVKVTSGSRPDVSKWIDSFYGSVIEAGTYRASSIKVAEAAKVIENTQRDLNIALINEFAIIFNLLGVDTLDVLEAAGSKWNFLPFKPGLVGGHCIGVDPYYLTHKAEQLGYYPQLVLAGRRINDGMGAWIAQQLVLQLIRRGEAVRGGKVMIMGFTFKENCPDTRNTRVIDIIKSLSEFGIECIVVDPYADAQSVADDYGLNVLSAVPSIDGWLGIVVAVAHDEFKSIKIEYWEKLLDSGTLLFDVKGIVPRQLSCLRI